MERKINYNARIEMVKAMERIARTVNDEEIFEFWLVNGVADGDITGNTEDDDLSCYVEDNDRYADLMDTFLTLMKRAYKSGGLYSDNVVSKPAEN